ncbi:MAG: mRNA surveillance protein pelota [Candidatus Thermoplasmatota archaeon]|nr:mRNA surveillance protein pelota [Candidatus Thermoplasmatota archaeon]
MKIIFKDLKHGEIKLLPENLDDIWHLYNIIEIDDLVRAVTFRTTEDDKDDKIRSKKSEKKRMKLGITVSEVKFHEFSDRLRIHGTIVEGPQDLGAYHTLNITGDSMEPLSIVKKNWKYYQIKRIDEAVEQRNEPVVTFVSLDEDTATIAVLRQSGIQYIADVSSKRSGKMYDSPDTVNSYFSEIISILKTTSKTGANLIVVGPGFTREHFVKHGREKNPELFTKYYAHSTGHASMNGIQEAIKTGIVKQITQENRVVFETEQVEKLFEEIRKNGLATYGPTEVEQALNSGAVERLLITDKVVRTKKGEKILDVAKQNNSSFTIINTMHDAGKKIDGIGGVGALLRFKI